MTKCMTPGLMGPSATIEWGTPQDLFNRLDAEFHFTLDVCASDGMQMCQRYFNPQTDGLAQVWGGGRSMLDEPTLRTGDRQVGAQGGHGASSHGRTAPGEDRYQVVSGMGPAPRIGGAVHQRARKIQRSEHGGTIPLDYRDIPHTKDTKIRHNVRQAE